MFTINDLKDLASEATKKINAGELRDGHALLESVAKDYISIVEADKLELSSDASDMLSEISRKLVIPDKPGLMHKKQCAKHAQAMMGILCGTYSKSKPDTVKPIEHKSETPKQTSQKPAGKPAVVKTFPENKPAASVQKKPNDVKPKAPETGRLALARKAFNEAEGMMRANNYVGAAAVFRTVIDLMTQYLAIDKGGYTGKDDPAKRLATLRNANVFSKSEAAELFSFYNIGSIATHEYALGCSEQDLRKHASSLQKLLNTVDSRKVPVLRDGEIKEYHFPEKALGFAQEELSKSLEARRRRTRESVDCLGNAIDYAVEYLIYEVYHQPLTTDVPHGIDYLYRNRKIDEDTRRSLQYIRYLGNKARHDESIHGLSDSAYDNVKFLVELCKNPYAVRHVPSSEPEEKPLDKKLTAAMLMDLFTRKTTLKKLSETNEEARSILNETDPEVLRLAFILAIVIFLLWPILI